MLPGWISAEDFPVILVLGDPPKLPDSLIGLSSELGVLLQNRDHVEHHFWKLEHSLGWLHQPGWSQEWMGWASWRDWAGVTTSPKGAQVGVQSSAAERDLSVLVHVLREHQTAEN